MIFLNLSAGLMARNYYKNCNYIRIQSSHIENKAYDKLFYGLPAQLLYHLAINKECVIVDCTSNGTGKVIKSGIPVILYVLYRLWYDCSYDPPKYIDIQYLDTIYHKLAKQTKAKLRYYKKFTKTKKIPLKGISLHVEKELP